MDSFDYSAFAEIFPGRQRNGMAGRYRRFETAAEALRFAMEDVPAKARQGLTLDVSEIRFGRAEIEELYRSADYPFARAAGAS